MLTKTAIGTLFYSVSTNRLLFNLRASHKSFSECWSLWGGMSESGEVPIETLQREITEEMGILPDIGKIYPFDIYESADGHFRYYSYVCIVSGEFVPVLNEESIGYAWLDYGHWPTPMHIGAKKSFTSKKGKQKLRMIIDNCK